MFKLNKLTNQTFQIYQPTEVHGLGRGPLHGHGPQPAVHLVNPVLLFPRHPEVRYLDDDAVAMRHQAVARRHVAVKLLIIIKQLINCDVIERL